MNEFFHFLIDTFFVWKYLLWETCMHFACWYFIQQLPYNFRAFFYLCHTYVIARKTIAAFVNRNSKIKVIVYEIRICTPQIMLHAACPETWSGETQINSTFLRNDTDTINAAKEYSVGIEKLFAFKYFFRKFINEAADN